MSSPVVTSYRVPIATIDLSLTVFTVLRLVTDRRNWSSKGWLYALWCISMPMTLLCLRRE